MGLSGKLGGIVFRNCNGVSVMAKAPKKSTKKPSQAQLNQTQKFKMASAWAVHTLKDPKEMEYYKSLGAKKGKSAYIMAMADFLNSDKETEKGKDRDA